MTYEYDYGRYYLYDAIADALDDERLVQHESYIPAGELSKDNIVVTICKVSDSEFKRLTDPADNGVTIFSNKLGKIKDGN